MNYLKSLITLSVLFFTLTPVSSQTVTWITWEQAQQLSAKEQKKIFVDVYTDWCSWCKKMDASTLQNPTISSYLNEKFYAIKFDAEYKKDIVLNGKTYKYVTTSKSGYHELAKEILKGQMSYPTIVVLDENFTLIQPIKGFQDVKTLNQILHYFGEDHHKRTPWQKFTQIYNSNIGINDNAILPVNNLPRN
jgi:thioredoxin-related protein